ncbi:nucleotidyltransferase domain-containing protein [Tenggerimyces flavus]|uniref:Nucleotidyltransferase domain-containing protein n=1 Tax=Tenggerimyces flavus TaxID=1708749 RepID=A0ABV7YGQ2_9ACTN|nr:nucleotidyltransferase domain-containing protein [Tenggerimyces flavus]MBM7784134.1 putative nucleotidyltransferase [Tenggerimyces flavus]
MVNPATEHKRRQLVDFIDRKLAPHSAIRAVIGVGSIATGTARPGSDIDAVVFMDPLDLYLVPAESIWRPSDDTFHSIMSGDHTLDRDGIQLDLHRIDLRVWRDPAYRWPEPSRQELANGWIAFDRDGEVRRLIDERTTYPDDERQRILDDAMPLISDHLAEDVVSRCWDTLGPLVAGDRLQSVYEYLVRALFAYNRQWRGWRNREMTALTRLPWLPTVFDEHIMAAALGGSGDDRDAYLGRAEALKLLSNQLLERLVADGVYGDAEPIDEAFIRAHDEPGRAWNMEVWNARHATRHGP